MISTKQFKQLHKKVNESRMPGKFYKGTAVAMICAPSIIVEMIVKKASIESGIPMDWQYSAGRGIVWALGDSKTARHHLVMNIPQTDLTFSDI